MSHRDSRDAAQHFPFGLLTTLRVPVLEDHHQEKIWTRVSQSERQLVRPIKSRKSNILSVFTPSYTKGHLPAQHCRNLNKSRPRRQWRLCNVIYFALPPPTPPPCSDPTHPFITDAALTLRSAFSGRRARVHRPSATAFFFLNSSHK